MAGEHMCEGADCTVLVQWCMLSSRFALLESWRQGLLACCSKRLYCRSLVADQM